MPWLWPTLAIGAKCAATTYVFWTLWHTVKGARLEHARTMAAITNEPWRSAEVQATGARLALIIVCGPWSLGIGAVCAFGIWWR